MKVSIWIDEIFLPPEGKNYKCAKSDEEGIDLVSSFKDFGIDHVNVNLKSGERVMTWMYHRNLSYKVIIHDPDKNNQEYLIKEAIRLELEYEVCVEYNLKKYPDAEETMPGDYYGICRRCGNIPLFATSNIPNDEIKLQNGKPKLCDFCNYPIISVDRKDKEYLLMYKDLTGEFPKNVYIEERFMSKIYMQEHADEVKSIFDPDLREQRIAMEDAKRAEKEGGNRSGQYNSGMAARQVSCPQCGSTSISTQKRGFKLGRAVAGTLLTGFLDVGAIAGAAGSGKYINICQRCGHKWKI